MVFSSITFLFFFLPTVIVAYFLMPRRWRNALLMLASLVFYAWGTGALVVLLAASIIANYVLGLTIERAVERAHRRRAAKLLALAVILNLGMLAWFKYATFAVGQLNQLLGVFGDDSHLPVLDILLPIGISFYTFHSLSYLIDIYRRVARHLVSPIDFALYITFFPQLVAGPIVRFHEIREQLLERRESRSQFAVGVYRFAHGLAKKVLIADTLAPLANAAFSTPVEQLGMVSAGLGLLAYTFQLYFDFSGYSDMAIGLAHMFGIRLPENFDRPYASLSVTEFWRRWHMSLSRWFRDYLYIPLGGNRGSRLLTYRNLIIVFLATGLWHGANWTFVLWGAYHGTLLLIERATGTGRGEEEPASRLGSPAHIRTLVLVILGWVLFRSPDIGYALGYLGAFLRPAVDLAPSVAAALTPVSALALLVGVASVFIPGDWVTGRRVESDSSALAEGIRLGAVAVAMPASLIVLIAGDFSPFLYFQF